MGKAVACEALNCKAVLHVELAGGKEMEIHTNKERLPAAWFYCV